MTDLQVPVHAQDHARGAESASAVLVMYGDYECPYTRRAYQVAHKLLAELPDVLRFVFRHFPLTDIHPHAQYAAEAAEAAAAQGKFWELHNTLFAHQRAIDDADLQRYAGEIGMEMPQFMRAQIAHVYAGRVEDDVQSGLASGVQGTPTLYLNGQLHTAGHDEEALRTAIMKTAAGRREVR